DHFKGRIFRGGSDQNDVAALDMRQKGILLGFVETVDFVHENNGAAATRALPLGSRHNLFDFLDAGEHGAKREKIAVGHPSDDAGKGCLAAPGWAPQDERGYLIALDLNAQRLAGGELVLLSDEFLQGLRP